MTTPRSRDLTPRAMLVPVYTPPPTNTNRGARVSAVEMITAMVAPRHGETQGFRWGARGAALNALGRYEETLRCFDRALALNPALAESRANRAVALRALGRG